MLLSRSFPYLASTGAVPGTRMLGSVLVVAGVCGWIGAAVAQNTADGSQVFMQSGCFVCHGQMGDGGAGPRLRGDPFLSITDYVAAQILLGRGIMPGFGQSLNEPGRDGSTSSAFGNGQRALGVKSTIRRAGSSSPVALLTASDGASTALTG